MAENQQDEENGFVSRHPGMNQANVLTKNRNTNNDTQYIELVMA